MNLTTLFFAASVSHAGPPAPSTGPQGQIGVAVVLPSGSRDVKLTASQSGENPEPVMFTDDGSLRVDLHDDGEWWALLSPRPGANQIRIRGVVDGRQLWHEELVQVPSAWMSTTYPVTFVGIIEGDEVLLRRTLSGAMPTPDDAPTGAGIAGSAEQLGLSPAALYLCWGLLILVVGAAATVRSAVVRARATPRPQ